MHAGDSLLHVFMPRFTLAIVFVVEKVRNLLYKFLSLSIARDEIFSSVFSMDQIPSKKLESCFKLYPPSESGIIKIFFIQFKHLQRRRKYENER